MFSNESCPDSHYRCLGDFNDCLPVYTRCNGMYDCLDHYDEEYCEDMKCPGFFKCRKSKTCVHSDHLCDGWSHCPMNDDELLCGVGCPVDCQCRGYSLLCHQPFHAAPFPRTRSLDTTDSGMTLSDVAPLHYLTRLVLVRSLTSSGGFGMFVSNLTMADFLMGVYIAIIGVADERFRGQYLHHDRAWKHSVMCK
ncbi:hypothetical protein ACOMHN_026650 [Nucella lapillus]